MSNIQTAAKDKVPVGQKATFGAGHFILNILPGTLGVFIQFFLLTAWGVDPLWAGLLGGLPRIFDSITDPIMGFISDNTKSRWGRRRPYIFIGAIISGILFFLCGRSMIMLHNHTSFGMLWLFKFYFLLETRCLQRHW